MSAIAVLVYVLSARLRQDRRAPAAAIAWVMGFLLVPYVVLPLFLVFGQRKLKVAFVPWDATRPPQMHWAALLLVSFGLRPPSETHVRFHTDGVAAAQALWDLLEKAQRSIDLSMFLIGNDDFGRAVVAKLAERARAGVAVRLLLDGLGVWSGPRAELRQLKAAGAQIAIFRPLFSMRRVGPRNLRNHRKLVIADCARLWAGGRNLAAEYFTGLDGAAPWLDLSFDLEGDVALAAAAQFAADWSAARGAQGAPILLQAPPVLAEGSLAQFLPSGPDQVEDTAHTLIVDGCFRARRRLLAVTPYIVPDESLKTAIRTAARRGVEVTLLLPSRSNHRLADFVRDRALRELAAAGARIRLLPRMIHAKAIVFDDELAICGSINLDPRSLLLNHESAVVFFGAGQVSWLANWLEALLGESVDYERRSPGLLREITEGLLLTVAFQI